MPSEYQEDILPGNIINQYNSKGTSEVTSGHCTVPFLSSSVPNLKFESLGHASTVNLEESLSELYTHCMLGIAIDYKIRQILYFILNYICSLGSDVEHKISRLMCPLLWCT